MEAKELRIGNYVQDKSYQHEAIIQMIDNQCGICSLEDGLCDLDLLEPIPLTEEWLLKFGFNKDTDGSYLKNDVSIFIDKRFKSNLYLQTNDKVKHYDWFGFELKVEHIHQLQNLYFALTQTELKIQ